MATEITIQDFAVKYLGHEILPAQQVIIAALLRGETILLGRANGFTSCLRVADHIRMEAVDREHARGYTADHIIMDEAS